MEVLKVTLLQKEGKRKESQRGKGKGRAEGKGREETSYALDGVSGLRRVQRVSYTWEDPQFGA